MPVPIAAVSNDMLEGKQGKFISAQWRHSTSAVGLASTLTLQLQTFLVRFVAILAIEVQDKMAS